MKFDFIVNTLFSKTFWFLILFYMTISLVRTMSPNQDYGHIANFLFPILKSEKQLLFILAGWPILIRAMILRKKSIFF